MESERDREIWDDATNAVCQAMQEQNMCNCPDGDCLAAKIDFSPEKIATATRPAPAATDTGLVTVEYQVRSKLNGHWVKDNFLSQQLSPDTERRELVTRSQAEELLAAERQQKEVALADRKMLLDLASSNGEKVMTLEAKLEAKYEHLCHWQHKWAQSESERQALEAKLAAAEKALGLIDKAVSEGRFIRIRKIARAVLGGKP